MQDRDFEEQVHKKMDELLIPPSDAVWQQVDRRLHDKRNRRRWIAWLPLLLACLSIGGYFFLSGGGVATPVGPFIASNATGEKAIRNTPGTAGVRSRPAVLPNKQVEDPKVKESASPAAVDQSYKKEAAGHIKRSTRNQQPAFDRSDNSASNNQVRTGKSNAAGTAKLQTTKPDEAATPAMILGTVDSNNTQSSFLATDDQLSTPTQLAVRDVMPIIVSATLLPSNTSIRVTANMEPTSHSGAPVIMPSPKATLEWGLIVSGGRSSINTGKFNTFFGNARVADMLAAGTSLNGIIRQASPLAPGAAATFGGYVQRKFSRRLALTVALQVNWLTTHHEVGVKVNNNNAFSVAPPNAPGNGSTGGSSSILPIVQGSYYLPGVNHRYTNNYVFLQLPVMLQTRIGSSSSPFNWDLGLSLSRMIYSNALHYDLASAIYYKDNSLFKKTQVNLITGFPVQIVNIRKFGLHAGPEMSYGITNLMSLRATDNKHVLFLGVKAKLRLGNK